MHVLVTGATGFLGGNLVRHLLRQGHHVRALKRPDTPASLLNGREIDIVEGDVTDPRSLLMATRGVEAVYHVAALVSYWRPLRRRLYEVNVEGTRNVIDASLRSGVRRLVHTSSIGALPIGNGSSRFGGIAEVQYWKTKYWAREVALQAIDRGLEVVVVSPAWTFGQGDVYWKAGRLFRLVAQRSFIPIPHGYTTTCDVDDVCVGHIAAMDRGRPGADYVLGGAVVTFVDLVHQIASVMGRRVRVTRMPYPLAQAMGWIVYALSLLSRREPAVTPEVVRILGLGRAYSSALAIRDLGYPQTPLRISLEKTYRWYREHGMLQ